MTPATHTPADSRPWQSIVDTLERAAAACDARGDRIEILQDCVIWRHHALTIRNAADGVREALPFELADSIPDTPGGPALLALDDLPAGSSAAAAVADAAPLSLLEEAWQEFDRLQGDTDWLGNVPLLVAGFEVADALTAVRNHYE